jgi:hypothetical protein
LALKRSDELAFEDWKRRNSTPCPQCSIPVQRSEGCAKMLCSKCSTPFCYVCVPLHVMRRDGSSYLQMRHQAFAHRPIRPLQRSRQRLLPPCASSCVFFVLS